MIEKYYYVALFHKDENGGFWINFPDIPGVFSQGRSINEAYEMAVEALGLAIEDYINEGNLPQATPFCEIKTTDASVPILIQLNYSEYLKKYRSKAVKKTLSIPEWLNTAAENKGVNFSSILQKGLKQELGMDI